MQWDNRAYPISSPISFSHAQMSFRLWPATSSSLMSGQAWRTWPTLVRGFSLTRVRRRLRSRCWLTLFIRRLYTVSLGKKGP